MVWQIISNSGMTLATHEAATPSGAVERERERMYQTEGFFSYLWTIEKTIGNKILLEKPNMYMGEGK